MVRKVLFVSFVSVLLLTISDCGRSSFGSNSNGRSNFGDSNSGINSIGGIGGDGVGSSTSSAPAQAADIMVSPSSPSIAVGATTQFTATTKDVSGAAFHWASSAPNVATINNSGVATGLAAGTTQITATAAGKSSPPVVLTLCDFRHL